MDGLAGLVAGIILETLATKHGKAQSEIIAGIQSGDPVLCSQVLKLAELGRQTAEAHVAGQAGR